MYLGELFQKRVGGDFFHVLSRHGNGSAKDQIPLMQLVHIPYEAVVDALAPPLVGYFLFSLDTHDRDEIAALVKELEIRFIHECRT